MYITPFQYLKQNINKIKFDCDSKYIDNYKKAFLHVLDRMDEYFIKNKLYKCGDYKAYVENMIKKDSGFSFTLDDEIMKIGCSGLHTINSEGKVSIAITSEYLNNGLLFEDTLCHEFLHYLTIGQEKLRYKKDDKIIEVEFNRFKGKSIEKVYKQENKNLTLDKTYQELLSIEAMNGGFICEAMTELTKQKIYPETTPSYKPQVEMIDFVSKMIDGPLSTKEFLQGDLQSFAFAMGNSGLYDFINNCKKFQDKFNKDYHIDYKNDNDYINIQYSFVKNFLNSISLQIANPKFKPSNITNVLSTLSSAPVVNRKYDSEIFNVKSRLSLVQHLEYDQNKKFRKLLDNTISKMISYKKQIYRLQNDTFNVSIQKTNDSFYINYNDSGNIPFNYFPQSSDKISFIKKDNVITKIRLIKTGIYEIESKNEITNKVETINLMIEDKNLTSMLIIDAKSNKKYKLNFKSLKISDNRNIEESQNLLDNFKHYQVIQNMISLMPSLRYCEVKKVVSNKDNEYLIATTATKTIFVKIVGKEYEIINIKEASLVDKTTVCNKILVGEGQANLVGYMQTKTQTDEDSIVYKLDDGTTFVKYYDKGRLAYGEQVSTRPNPTIISIKNTNLYSSSNKLMESIFNRPQVSYDKQKKPENKKVSNKR